MYRSPKPAAPRDRERFNDCRSHQPGSSSCRTHHGHRDAQGRRHEADDRLLPARPRPRGRGRAGRRALPRPASASRWSTSLRPRALYLPGRGEAGLFHTALLFEDQAALAATVATAAQYEPQSFTGSADHLVSEAFYFNDPEGNGIELYWDRPREAWSWDGTNVVMDSLALPPQRYLRAAPDRRIRGRSARNRGRRRPRPPAGG